MSELSCTGFQINIQNPFTTCKWISIYASIADKLQEPWHSMINRNIICSSKTISQLNRIQLITQYITACRSVHILVWEPAKDKMKIKKVLRPLHSSLYSNRAFPSCNKAFFAQLSSCIGQLTDTEYTRFHKAEPGSRSHTYAHIYLCPTTKLYSNTYWSAHANILHKSQFCSTLAALHERCLPSI